MEVVNYELDVMWLSGSQIAWIDSVVAEPSESGFVEPIGRQSRFLMQATFSTWDAALVRTMWARTRSGRKAFLIRPPLDDFSKVTNITLGVATGSSQVFQLINTVADLTWNILYPDSATLIVYDNGTPLTVTTDYTLGALGVLTLNASGGRTGHTISATYEYRTPVRFLDAELQQTVEAIEHQVIQSATVREVFL